MGVEEGLTGCVCVYGWSLMFLPCCPPDSNHRRIGTRAILRRSMANTSSLTTSRDRGARKAHRAFNVCTNRSHPRMSNRTSASGRRSPRVAYYFSRLPPVCMRAEARRVVVCSFTHLTPTFSRCSLAPRASCLCLGEALSAQPQEPSRALQACIRRCDGVGVRMQCSKGPSRNSSITGPWDSSRECLGAMCFSGAPLTARLRGGGKKVKRERRARTRSATPATSYS